MEPQDQATPLQMLEDLLTLKTKNLDTQSEAFKELLLEKGLRAARIAETKHHIASIRKAIAALADH